MPDGMKRVFQTQLDQIYDTDLEGLGTLRWEGNNCYKWMKTLASGVWTVAALAGTGAGWVAKYYQDDGYDQNLVGFGNTAESQHGAGVTVVSTAAADHGEYQWFQIRGSAALALVIEGSPGSDDPLTVDPSVVEAGACRKLVSMVDDRADMYPDEGTSTAGTKVICNFVF